MLLLGVGLITTSCEEQLAEINRNPNAVAELPPSYLFSLTQLQVSGDRYENWRANLIYSSCFIQHFSALASYWTGDKYTYNAGYSSSLWDRNYPNALKTLETLMANLQADPAANVNLISQLRIFRVYTYHRLTDLYGDIPYSEAIKGYSDQIFKPKYDTQQSIYADLLKELEEAINAMNASQPTFGNADFMYQGDIDQWKRWGYSQMLRIAMRMQKVDNGLASTWAAKAIAGGVMTSNDDIAFIPHTDGPDGINMNGIGQVFLPGVEPNPRLSATLVDFLASNNDPRLNVFGFVASGGDQKGLPNGYDQTTIQGYAGGADLATYTQVNPLLVRTSSPMFFQTYAEVELLWAEAILRGYVTGDAAAHYNNGVRAGMKQWELYDASLAIEDAAIDAYLAAHPFDAARGYEMIGEQYWVATFLNSYEAYANWRRLGLPALTPVNYPGNESNGQIPRRLRYPATEISLNEANYLEASARMTDGDAFTSRMWWDKQ
ncbi:MAG: SusD/RagB family nutrient-binding outer membrane lipoprotein [Bacteroidia bacterium]